VKNTRDGLMLVSDEHRERAFALGQDVEPLTAGSFYGANVWLARALAPRGKSAVG
jgi:hypothetical protein